LAGEQVILRGQEGRHATTVRRLAPGEEVYLTDGAGTVAQCVVEQTRPGQLVLTVVSRQTEPYPDPALIVVQAIPKGDRAELAVELLTEVGADVIVPWTAERCIVQWRGDRAERGLARWRSTALQAGKQSRRAWLPQVTAQASTAALGERVGAAGLAVVLDADAPMRLADLDVPATGDIVVIVGPEGGITPAENHTLVSAGAVGARLGPTVLRASSAGAVAAGILLSRTMRW
jgi:16S rRNA (uracil1498-N3)-methyltransferase